MNKVRSKDGTLIAYESSGSGPALLLIHGGGSHPERWRPIGERFEPSFSVYRMARRGVAGSGESIDWSPERQGEDVAAVVDAIGGPVNVLGHSYGAMCAIEGACLTKSIARLILYEPPFKLPLPPPAFFDKLGAMLAAGDRDGVNVAFNREIARMPEHEIELQKTKPGYAAKLESIHTVIFELQAVQLYKFNAAKMGKVTIPVMLLLGGDSPPFFRESAELAHAALPNSRIVVLPGQQHIAMDTAPDLFVREVTSFLT